MRARTGKHRVDVYGRGFTDQVMQTLHESPDVKSAAASDGHVVLEMQNGSAVPQMVRMLVAQGVEVEEVLRDKASLEDVFLTLVEEDAHA